MNENYKALFEEIDAHLGDSNENNAEKLLKRDELLDTEMTAFATSLSTTQIHHWNEIRRQVDELRMYAKLAKLRLMDGDENLKSVVSRLKSSTEKSGDKEEAAIEIAREMHEYTGVVGVLQSLLMWKPNPEEKLKEKE